MSRVLRWDLYNNSVLGDGKLYLNLDPFETTQARFATLRVGGLGDGTLELVGIPRQTARDAVKNWLMKEARFTAPNGDVPYLGFVGELTVEYGYRVYRRRIGWIGNRVVVRYLKRDTTGRAGSKRKRVTVEDAESQARYGVRTLRVDLTDQGIMSTAQATDHAEILLAKYKNFVSKTKSSSPREPRIRISLWSRWMTTGWQDVLLRYAKAKKISVIVQAALASCPFVTADYSDVNDVGTSIKYNSNGMRRAAQEVMVDALQYGDSNSRRLLLQMWGDGVPHLNSVPTTIGLYGNTGEERVWGDARTPLPNWGVRAGDYMLDEDWDDSLDVLTDATADERAVLIEKTEYNALLDSLDAESADLEDVASVMGKTRRGRRRILA